jgi:hypothetical protein
MNRQRKRRINAEVELSGKGEGSAEAAGEDPSAKIVFMEELNYKMDYKDSARPSQLVVLRSEEFTEEERREAFKKKLRKYSSRIDCEQF